jgi:hypothetical protein
MIKSCVSRIFCFTKAPKEACFRKVLPPLQSGSSLELPTGQFIYARSSLSPPKQYDQILRQQDFLFYQSTEGSVLP